MNDAYALLFNDVTELRHESGLPLSVMLALDADVDDGLLPPTLNCAADRNVLLVSDTAPATRAPASICRLTVIDDGVPAGLPVVLAVVYVVCVTAGAVGVDSLD